MDAATQHAGADAAQASGGAGSGGQTANDGGGGSRATSAGRGGDGGSGGRSDSGSDPSEDGGSVEPIDDGGAVIDATVDGDGAVEQDAGGDAGADCTADDCGLHGTCENRACVCEPPYAPDPTFGCAAGPVEDGFSQAPSSCELGARVSLAANPNAIESHFAASAFGDDVAVLWEERAAGSTMRFGTFATDGDAVIGAVDLAIETPLRGTEDIDLATGHDRAFAAWVTNSPNAVRYAVIDDAGVIVKTASQLALGRLPRVVATAEGFALVWREDPSIALRLARFDADGDAIGSPVTIDTAVVSHNPAIAWSGSELGVAWSSADFRLRFRRFDGAGQALMAAVDVDSQDGNLHQSLPELVYDRDRFLVAYNYSDNRAGVNDEARLCTRVWSTETDDWTAPMRTIGANNPGLPLSPPGIPTAIADASGFIVARYWPGGDFASWNTSTLLAHLDRDGGQLGASALDNPDDQTYHDGNLVALAGGTWLVAALADGASADIEMSAVACDP